MKKALILAHDFPPNHSIGAQRPYSWHRYFKKFGIVPTIIARYWDKISSSEELNLASSITQTQTVSSPLGTIYQVPYKENVRDRLIAHYGMNRLILLRKLLTLIFNVGQYFSFRFDGLSSIYVEAEKRLKNENFDVIIATGEPFVLFRHAAKLSKKYHIPWVADYRDGWSTIEHISYYGKLEQFIFLNVFRSIEKKLLADVSLITTASPNYKDALEELHYDKKVEVIYNGYDDDLISWDDSSAMEKEFFKLAYLGTLYPYQPIELFLEGLKRFKKQKPEIQLQVFFYGMNFNEAQKNRVVQAADSTVKEHLVFTEKVPKAALYQLAKNTHLFILLGHKSVKALAGKLFDYLLLKRQILFIQPDGGPQEAILTQCETGLFCEDAQKVCNYLAKYYEAWENGESFLSEAKNYKQFSREVQAKRMVELINRI